MVEDYMLIRFGILRLKYVYFDGSGFFMFKFDDEKIVPQLLSMSLLDLRFVKFVFHPNFSMYPSLKTNLSSSCCWVQFYKVPTAYWSCEGYVILFSL